MFDFKKTSAGEVLCGHLYKYLVDENIWIRLEERHLHTTARPKQMRAFFQEATALNITRRLLLAAEFIRETKCLDPSALQFPRFLEKPIRKIGLTALNSDGKISRLVRDALVCSRHRISDRLRKHVLNWSKAKQDKCYLCGRSLNFDVSDEQSEDVITLDHVWPQAYGGDSEEDNLLPACRLCNTKKKCDYASWAGCNVHTLMIGIQPSPEAKRTVGSHFQYALHNRAIRAYANQKAVTLREAYLEVGPWVEEAVHLDDEDVGDFFNLVNFDTDRNEYGTELLQMS